MKKTISIAAVLAVSALAAPTFAQETVELMGEAEPYCNLPTTWVYATGNGGQYFSGSTWSLPQSIIANTSGIAITGGEYPIRVTGEGSCNTSHRFQLQSSRGGLRADVEAPTGFSNRREIRYDAYWSTATFATDGVRAAYGPAIGNWRPSTPGQMSSMITFTATGTRPAPGNRFFDVRIGLLRDAADGPLVASDDYQDQLTITVSFP